MRVCVRISRRNLRPSFCKFVAPLSEERAQGMPGARCTRGLVCQELRIWRTRAYRFSGNTPASPAQWLYGLLRALPGGAGLLSPSPAETCSAELSASIAAPGPHDFAVRSRPGFAKLRRADRHSPMACCVHRIPRPTCRDDGDTPLWWARDGVVYNSDFQKLQANIFACRTDSPNQLEIAREFRFFAQRPSGSARGSGHTRQFGPVA